MIEITLVGMYADTSPACVSIIGSAVRDPPPANNTHTGVFLPEGRPEGRWGECGGGEGLKMAPGARDFFRL